MARPLRIEFPGAIYHVMSRGNARQTVFRDDSDYQRLSKGLETVVGRLGWDLLCFVLMPNHFHLLVRTPRPNLSRGMQHLTSDPWPQLFADVSCIALWISSEEILTRLYSVLHWFHKRHEVNVKTRENRMFSNSYSIFIGSVDSGHECTVLWRIALLSLMPISSTCCTDTKEIAGKAQISHPDTPTGAADVIGVRGTHFRAGSRVN